MIRVAIVVEGQTEEEFVKLCLAEHLRNRGIKPWPILMRGDVSVERLMKEIARLLHSCDIATSLVDFYRFRDKGSLTVDELEEELTRRIKKESGDRWHSEKVFPYVQKYEFEGLLFSDVDAFGKVLDLPARSVEKLREIREAFPTPEDINDDPRTAPSKRISKIIPRYRKVNHGPLIADHTGLAAIRAQCPRFNNWVARLESLGGSR